jgi:hypothetical protein
MSEPEIAIAELKPNLPAVADLPDGLYAEQYGLTGSVGNVECSVLRKGGI